MTPKLQIDLSDVGCMKPGCKRRYSGPMHRHHIRHKKFWINRWENSNWGTLRVDDRDRWGYFIRRLKERYHQWLARDLIRLCDYHHVEIHAIYSRINRDALYRIFNRDGKVTIRDMVSAMRECKQACRTWLEKPSAGMNPRRAGWRNS